MAIQEGVADAQLLTFPGGFMNQLCDVSHAAVDLAIGSDEVQGNQARPSADSEVRVDKILEIRRQLGEGTYSIADRLEVVIERIIQDLS